MNYNFRFRKRITIKKRRAIACKTINKKFASMTPFKKLQASRNSFSHQTTLCKHSIPTKRILQKVQSTGLSGIHE